MNIKTCDRCGQLIPEEESVNGLHLAIKHLTGNIKAIIHPVDTFEITKNGEQIDLCEDCIKSFKEWYSVKAVYIELDEQHRKELKKRLSEAQAEDIKFGEF